MKCICVASVYGDYNRMCTAVTRRCISIYVEMSLRTKSRFREWSLPWVIGHVLRQVGQQNSHIETNVLCRVMEPIRELSEVYLPVLVGVNTHHDVVYLIPVNETIPKTGRLYSAQTSKCNVSVKDKSILYHLSLQGTGSEVSVWRGCKLQRSGWQEFAGMYESYRNVDEPEN